MVFFSLLKLSAQSKIVKEVSDLLTRDGIMQAEQLVDEYILKKSNDADAFILKGNVIYSKYVFFEPQRNASNTINESVFEPSSTYDRSNASVIPTIVGRSVTDYWLKALTIDSEREDLHFGICNMYSISLMSSALIAYLPILKEKYSDRESLAKSMCAYARNIIMRDRFQEGLRVYGKIVELFPHNGTVLASLAEEWYNRGNLEKAKDYIHRAMLEDDKNPDVLSFLCDIYGYYLDFDKVLIYSSVLSEVRDDKEYLLYKALWQLKNDSSYKKSLVEYLKIKHLDKSKKELATFLLDDYKDNYHDFEKIMKIKMDDNFKIIICSIFNDKHRDRFLPAYTLASTLAYHYNYEYAIRLFSKIKLNSNNQPQRESFYLYYSWSVYSFISAISAIELWKKLVSSENFYYKSAAAWFIGKFYDDAGDYPEAERYFKLVVERPSDSKYAAFCLDRMKR